MENYTITTKEDMEYKYSFNSRQHTKDSLEMIKKLGYSRFKSKGKDTWENLKITYITVEVN